MKSESFHRVIILTFVLTALLISCRGKTRSELIVPDGGRNDMTELNRYLVQKDREIIQNYIERKDLGMRESSTGLWYLIKKEGSVS